MNLFDNMPQHRDTLVEARRVVRANREDGIECPCCGRYVRVHKRKMNSSMTRALIWLVLYWAKHQDWVDVPTVAPSWLLRTKQLSICEWWGLIERMDKDPDDTARKHSGYWRPTQRGVDFVYGRVSIPSHVFHSAGPTVEGSQTRVSLCKRR